MNGISRPWRAGFIGGSGCSVGACDHPKMQENVRKAVKNIRVISRKEMTRMFFSRVKEQGKAFLTPCTRVPMPQYCLAKWYQ
jgi:lipoprotein